MELVEVLLSRQRQESLWMAQLPELAVLLVEEHVLGWLVFWQSVEYIRSRDIHQMLLGHGPYLVDRQDGSIHHVPFGTYGREGWEELYLQQVRGVRPPEPPEPLITTVRTLVRSDGMMAAMRHLRKRAPLMRLQQAKAYVMAVREGNEPPEELVDLTLRQEQEMHLPLSIETLAGPVQ
ncbi:hypothetical protein GCM10009665_34330 [Kitasatospora nipponensis]|uniref:Immunity protein 35 domain-containing protein n=1 Tax=Kitasatospora nipponensis TaxID=258049 RepID=A0ABN1W8L5_9ACTN